MKKLTVIGLLFLGTWVWADDGQSFVTGFAQGLNNALQSRQGYYPQQYSLQPSNQGMEQQQLELWMLQQQQVANQQEQLRLQRQQLEAQQYQTYWYNK